jgi:hypothetical protein
LEKKSHFYVNQSIKKIRSTVFGLAVGLQGFDQTLLGGSILPGFEFDLRELRL